MSETLAASSLELKARLLMQGKKAFEGQEM